MSYKNPILKHSKKIKFVISNILFKNIKALFFFIAAALIGLSQSCTSKKAVPSPDKFDFHKVKEVASIIPDSLKYLIPIFDTILCTDQKFRESNNLNLYLQNVTEQNKLDSINLIKVESIINKYGLLGFRQFGLKGNLAVTAVLQHSKLKVQEKYLPLVEEAYKKKNVTGDFFAMFTDRINVKNNRFQKYGTQLKMYKNIYTLYPVVNIDSINIWRKEMKQISIEDYLKIFKTTFNREEYKKQLPELILHFKVKDTM